MLAPHSLRVAPPSCKPRDMGAVSGTLSQTQKRAQRHAERPVMSFSTPLFMAVLAVTVAATCASGIQVLVDGNYVSPPPFRHFWKHSVGSGHALLGTRADWQAQLRRVVSDIGFERVRMHGLFDDDMSVVLGPGQYEFYNIDQVYDFLLSVNVRPIVELSFMPGVLAGCWPWNPAGAKCQYVMHYDGIVQPPTNFSDWQDLCTALAQHLVDRYGLEEVRTWHFEVWNELWGMNYPHPYLDLYEASYRGIKSVDSQLKVGGPATMQCQWVADFVSDTQGNFDFVSTHLYPTDPNCTWPAAGFNDIDCFANTITRARQAAPSDKPFFLTEYNAGLFNAELLYSSYAAAFVFRNVPLLEGVLDVWSYWTFSDIFEENGMHSAPFEGFNYGIQTVQGLKKPVYRAFEMLMTAGGARLNTSVVNGPAANGTISAFATYDSATKVTSVFVSNFAPQFFPIDAQSVTISLDLASSDCSSLYPSADLTFVGGSSGDVYTAWVAMGSPSYPTKSQMEALTLASEAKKSVESIAADGSACSVTVAMPPYSVARIDYTAQ